LKIKTEEIGSTKRLNLKIGCEKNREVAIL